jgi:hypothetical protein
MSRMPALALVVGLVAAPAASGCARTGRLSATEVVARNVAARGGPDAWRKVETMVWTGHIESAHAPAPSMPFELEQKRPNKTRLQINALGDKSVRVFDGVRGWKMRSGSGRPEAEPYTQQEWRSAEAGHGLDGPLIDYAAKGSSVTLEGVDELGGRPAYHLRVHLATGGSEEVWVDAETFLDVRCDRMAEGPGDVPRRVSMTYGDYRAVDGLQIPFLITTGGGSGTTPDKMQIEKVVLNVPLDDAAFGNPAAPRPRRRALPSVALQATAPSAPSLAPSAAPTASSERRGSAPQ